MPRMGCSPRAGHMPEHLTKQLGPLLQKEDKIKGEMLQSMSRSVGSGWAKAAA